MHQITFKIDEGDFKSLSSLLKKINSERASPLNLSCLLRVIVSEALGNDDKGYRYVREHIRKTSIKPSGKHRQNHKSFAGPEAEKIESQTKSIKSLHKEFDNCCERLGMTPAAFAKWLIENEPKFDRKMAINWYYDANLPYDPGTQKDFVKTITKLITGHK